LAAFEFEGMRIDMAESRNRFNESAEIVLAALENGYIEADTQHFKIPRRDIRPEPIYSFKNRTFGAGGSTPSMPIMARLGAGLLIVPVSKWEQVEADLAAYKAAWAEFRPNEPRPKPLLDQFVFVDKDPEKAKRKALQYLEVYLGMVLAHYDFAGDNLKGVKGYEQYAKTSAKAAEDAKGFIATFANQQAWGTPEQVIEKLADGRRRIDPSSLLLHFCFGGMPVEEAEASMRLFAREVLPEVRTWEPDPFGQLTPLPSAARREQAFA